MFGNLSFDELNALVKNERSMPFEQYFGEMSLPADDKAERIRIAEELEERFIDVMAVLFTMVQTGRIDYEKIRRQLEDSYFTVIRKHADIDAYLETYITGFSYDIVDSTKRHESNPYYYSIDRARYMAENEINTVINHVQYINAVNTGKTMKYWESVIDSETRKDHREVNGKYIPIGQAFQVGDSWLLFPKDTSLGASAEQIVNCRCSIRYY